MLVFQKSPIFWSDVPFAAFAAAAFSLISRKRLSFSSTTRLPIPQEDCSPGIGFFFIHPPLAYSKKSFAGLIVVSKFSVKISLAAEVSPELFLQENRHAAIAQLNSSFLII